MHKENQTKNCHVLRLLSAIIMIGFLLDIPIYFFTYEFQAEASGGRCTLTPRVPHWSSWIFIILMLVLGVLFLVYAFFSHRSEKVVHLRPCLSGVIAVWYGATVINNLILIGDTLRNSDMLGKITYGIGLFLMLVVAVLHGFLTYAILRKPYVYGIFQFGAWCGWLSLSFGLPDMIRSIRYWLTYGLYLNVISFVAYDIALFALFACMWLIGRQGAVSESIESSSKSEF